MTERTKDYFHRMYEDASRFHQGKYERGKEKQALIAADDWDAVNAWYEREKQYTDPFTPGQYRAYRAFDESSEIETGEFVMSNSLWEDEVKDFSDTLRAAGVTTFILAHQSTGLMEDIHNLEAQGWHLAGTCKLAEKKHRFGEDRIEVRLGLRFEIEKEG